MEIWHSTFQDVALTGVGGFHLSQQLASQPNVLVAQLAGSIVVAHASSKGMLAALVKGWTQDGRRIVALDTLDTLDTPD